MKKKKILIGVTGASAMLFLRSFLELLSGENLVLHGICSDAGKQVLSLEQDCRVDTLPAVSKWFDQKDFTAPPASGSAGYDAMVIIPCSMGTLAAIASGISSNLIQRSADVILKEKKKLLLVVRETPLNRTHLKNMLAVHDAGATVCPPHPGLYLKPETLAEAAQTFSWRLADLLEIEIADRKRWGEEQEEC